MKSTEHFGTRIHFSSLLLHIYELGPFVKVVKLLLDADRVVI